MATDTSSPAYQWAQDRRKERAFAALLEINRELVLSTSHMPAWLAAALDVERIDGKVGDERAENLVFDNVEYGYLVWAGNDDANVPAEILPVLQLARKHDCKWVRFDCDGFVVDGLTTWEW